MFGFRNIDNFIPGRFERMGMLRGKRWYTNTEDDKDIYSLGLFKPQRKEFGNKRIFCANHYGEFVGYLLGINTDIDICKAELAHLSEYHENIHKVRNRAKGEEKNGCISYSKLKRDEELEHGRVVVDMFAANKPELYNELSKNDKEINKSDNIEVVLAAIENRIRNFYTDKGDCSEEFIDEKVAQNRRKALEMIVFDCLYGNNDRHDENWALVKNRAGTEIGLYSLYDNERILGLYENQEFIEDSLGLYNKSKDYTDSDIQQRVERISEECLFSRMRVPGEEKKRSTYKDVLEYLAENYREDTIDILEKNLRKNTPQIVHMFVSSCEGLPHSYIDFQKIMYNSRYTFARELCEKYKYKTLTFIPKQDLRKPLSETDERDIV